nr:isoleucine N-monooxygenase 2-like [Ipomoea batatas]
MLAIIFSSTTLPLMILIISVLLLLSCKWIVRKQKANKQLPLPPGPMAWPIVGCFPQLLRNKPVFRWMLNLMEEMNTEIACFNLGGTNVIAVTSPEVAREAACFNLGGTNVIAVTSPEVAREVLKKQDSVFASRPTCMSAELMSSNYLISVVAPMGEQWKKMRRVLSSHVVSPNALNWLYNKRATEADHLVHYIYNQCRNAAGGCGGVVVDVRAMGKHFCGNVMKQMVFSKRYFKAGAEDGGPGVEDEEHIDATFGVLDLLYSFGISDYFPWLRMFDLEGHRKAIQKAVEGVRKYQDPEVDERIKMWKDGAKTDDDEKQDILDVLINLKDAHGTNDNNCGQSFKRGRMGCSRNVKPTRKFSEEPRKNLNNVVGKERLVQESDLPRLNYLKRMFKGSISDHPIIIFVPPHLCSSDHNPVQLFHPQRLLQGFEKWSVPSGGRVDLKESKDSILLANLSVLFAKPRLPHHIYSSLEIISRSC